MNAQAAAPPPLMPYGAPELKSGARRLLVRAVIMGSATWSALFLIALALSMLVMRTYPPRTVTLIPKVFIDPEPWDTPHSYDTPPKAPPTQPRQADAGEFKPTADKLPDEVVLPQERQDGPKGPPSPPDDRPSGEPAIGPFVADTLPGPNDSVYFDEFPVELRRVEPVYPQLAVDAGVEGTVLVRALIGKDGLVKDAFVIPKHSVPLLDDAALTAVRKWRFTPALSNKHPVPVWIAVPVRFTLRH